MKKRTNNKTDFKESDSMSVFDLRQTVTDIVPELKTKEKQKLKQGGGLEVIFILKNHSDQDKIILNPLDYIQIEILDEEGWPVKVPVSKTKRAMMNPTNEKVKISRPFNVQVLELTEGKSKKLNRNDDKNFLVEVNKSYEFKIIITKVQDYDAQNVSVHSLNNKPIQEGKYQVRLKLTVMLVEDLHIFSIWDSSFQNIKLI